MDMMEFKDDDKRYLYQLILSQLRHDGYHGVATQLSESSMTPFPELDKEEKGKLETLVKSAIHSERQQGNADTQKMDVSTKVAKDIKGLDLESEARDPVQKRPFPNYTTRFITTHKDGCRVAKFSPDGKLVATGSMDTSIKLLDVEKMLAYSQVKNETDDITLARPVIRTFYDHTERVNDLDFHPTLPVLVSAAADCTIKFYDYSSSVKRGFKFLQDSHNVRTINLHPSGDYVIAGTEHNMIRLYDINTRQAFVSPNTDQNHFGPINQVRFTSDGKMFASCSKDGTVKLWDGVTLRCFNTIPQAHSGQEVCTVQFSRNRKYLLTGGKDCMVYLWDLSTGDKLLRLFTGAPQQTINKHRLQCSFSYNEDFVLTSDEIANAGVVWDTRLGELVQRLTGHNNVVRWIGVSPTEPHVMTCSEDHRARFWVEEKSMM